MPDATDLLASFRSRLPIDGHDLSRECMGQASLYDEIGQFVAGLKRDARIAKDEVDFTRARLKKEARQAPGTFGIAKVTESAIEEAVESNQQLVNAKSKNVEAQYLSDCAGALLIAAEQRKSMIRDTVNLAIHQLYSTYHDMSGDKRSLDSAKGKVALEDMTNYRRQVAESRKEESARGDGND